VVDKGQPQFVTFDRDDLNKTGRMLAALATIPQVTFATKVTIAAPPVTREVIDGAESLSLMLTDTMTAMK
jgi:electron transfer flavoprotein beta subunit